MFHLADGNDTVSLNGFVPDPPVNELPATMNGGHGSDTLVGGNLDDFLHGDAGNDTITGGAGADQLHGGDGDDTLNARDGAGDTVLCGAGTDAVTADPHDTIVGACEFIKPIDDDGDGAPLGVDCNDDNARIWPGADDIPGNGVDEDCSGRDGDGDLDGDGAVWPADCDDTNPGWGPRVADKPQNGVDENCDGKDADWHVNRTVISSNWRAFVGYTLVDRLSLRNIPAGGKTTVKCTGGGCPFKATRLKVANRRANATKLLKRRRLATGTVINIEVTAPDTMGKIVRYTMRSRKPPAKRELCDPPGKQKPGKC